MLNDWPGYLDWFFSLLFPEPHSTKPFEDGVRYGWASSGEVVDWARNGWLTSDVRALARRVQCPTLVIHGDADQRVPHARGEAIRSSRRRVWCIRRNASCTTSSASLTLPSIWYAMANARGRSSPYRSETDTSANPIP